jgi:hypothetical protein
MVQNESDSQNLLKVASISTKRALIFRRPMLISFLLIKLVNYEKGVFSIHPCHTNDMSIGRLKISALFVDVEATLCLSVFVTGPCNPLNSHYSNFLWS